MKSLLRFLWKLILVFGLGLSVGCVPLRARVAMHDTLDVTDQSQNDGELDQEVSVAPDRADTRQPDSDSTNEDALDAEQLADQDDGRQDRNDDGPAWDDANDSDVVDVSEVENDAVATTETVAPDTQDTTTPPNYDEGVLGDPPVGCELLSPLEIRNDRPFERPRDLAYAGIPLPKSAAVIDPASLIVVDEQGRWIQAQFNTLSRWNSPLGDPTVLGTVPIKWLQVALPLSIAGETTRMLWLKRCPVAVTPPTDPLAVTIDPIGGTDEFLVKTGVGEFTLNPHNPALLESITLNFGASTSPLMVYEHKAGAGPRVLLGSTDIQTSQSYDGTGNHDITVDPDPLNPTRPDFKIVERGPLKVVVRLRGHFTHPDALAHCPGLEFPFKERGPLGFSIELTFVRGEPHVGMRFNFRNECGNWEPSQIDESLTVQRVSWDFPLSITAERYSYRGLSTARKLENFSGVVRVEQQKGGVDSQDGIWKPRALVSTIKDGESEEIVESGTALTQPYLALGNSSVIAVVQMPWMRWREPQALVADHQTLSLQIVSRPLVVGEAKAIWSVGRLTFFQGSQLPDLPNEVDRQMARMNRGLLVRLPLKNFNNSRVLPSLGSESQTSKLKSIYKVSIERIHDHLIGPPLLLTTPGQWKKYFTYGSQLWPDIVFDSFSAPGWTDPTQGIHYANAGDPAVGELYEFYRSGDPKWVWDFSVPQTYLMLYSAWYNIGDQPQFNSGFVGGVTGKGEGHWHRKPQYGPSWGRTENQSTQHAFLLRPSQLMRDRFLQAGRSVTEFYKELESDRGDVTRLEFHNANSPGSDGSQKLRQHLDMLQNCAEFVEGEPGATCMDRLVHYTTELATDNIRGGLPCVNDAAPTTTCAVNSLFDFMRLGYLTFVRLLGVVPDGAPEFKTLLVNTVSTYLDLAIAKSGPGTIDLDAPWSNQLSCDLTNNQPENCVAVTGNTVHPQMFLQILALPLMARQLEPSLEICAMLEDVLEQDKLYTSWLSLYTKDNQGWSSGNSPQMQSVIFAVGGLDECKSSN